MSQTQLDELVKDETQNDLNSERMSIEELIEINRNDRKKMILMITGILSSLLGAVTIIILAALNEITISLEYMAYRYIATGEYAYAPVSFKIPYIVVVVILCIGIMCFLLYFRLKKHGIRL